MQTVETKKWQDLEQSKTLSDLYACAYSDFISGWEVAKILNKKNIGMYTTAFNEYENILFERRHKQKSDKSDKFRSLSQPLINIIKRDTKISKTTVLKKAIDSYDFRKIIARHKLFKTHKDILSWIGLIGIKEYYRYEIRKFKNFIKHDIEKTKNKMEKNYDKILPWIKIQYDNLNPKDVIKTNKLLLKIDIDTHKKLMILYPEYKAILTGIKDSLLYYLYLTK